MSSLEELQESLNRYIEDNEWNRVRNILPEILRYSLAEAGKGKLEIIRVRSLIETSYEEILENFDKYFTKLEETYISSREESRGQIKRTVKRFFERGLEMCFKNEKEFFRITLKFNNTLKNSKNQIILENKEEFHVFIRNRREELFEAIRKKEGPEVLGKEEIKKGTIIELGPPKIKEKYYFSHSEKEKCKPLNKEIKLLVIGWEGTHIKKSQIIGLCMKKGIQRKNIDIFDYEKTKSFSFGAIKNGRYDGILIGPNPHNIKNCHNLISTLRDGTKDGYSPFEEVRISRGRLKITKSSFERHLDRLLEKIYSEKELRI